MSKITIKSRILKMLDNLVSDETITWAELKAEYDYWSEGLPNFTSMNLSRILRKHAVKVRRGVYKKKQFDYGIRAAELYSDCAECKNTRTAYPHNCKSCIHECAVEKCACDAVTLRTKDASIVKTGETPEEHHYEWCQHGKTITASMDLSEGSMVAVCRAILKNSNVSKELEERLVNAAKMYSESQENLHKAAENYSDVQKHLDSVLEEVKVLIK